MYILFDIGGTKMRIVGSRDCERFVNDPIVIDTPKDFEEGVKVLKEKIKIISTGEDVKMITGGISGPFDRKTGCLVGGPNLVGWIGKPFISNLKEDFDVPIYVENDTVVVGLGEMHYGAGSKDGIGVYMTISTGVGGARFIDGYVDKATIGFEPGHQIIDAGKGLCLDCENGELESYIGGAATERRTGKKAYNIKDEAFWDMYARYLAYGLNNTIVHWSPEVVVLGGSMIVGDPAIPLDHTKECLKGILKIFPEIPEIKRAELEELGGLYGAMILATQHQKNNE